MKIKSILIGLMLLQCLNVTAQQKESQQLGQELQSLKPNTGPKPQQDKKLEPLNPSHNSSEKQYDEFNKSNKSRNLQKHYDYDDVFVCESINYRRKHCYANTEGGVRLVRQLSRGYGSERGSCLNNWGYDYYGVWVINGCRAEFATNRYQEHYGSNDGIVRCESYNYQKKTCPTDLRNAEVSLIHQLSHASCTNNWGYNRSGIWVDNGCKADFFVSTTHHDDYNQSEYIDCFSNNRRTRVCEVPDLASVSIEQIHSRPQRSCQGKWGYSRDGIWVKSGCRATFKIEPFTSHDYPGDDYDDPVTSELVRCQSKRYRYKACEVGRIQDVQLERVLRKSNCSSGNWGVNYEGGIIWVRNGCQAEFRVFH